MESGLSDSLSAEVKKFGYTFQNISFWEVLGSKVLSFFHNVHEKVHYKMTLHPLGQSSATIHCHDILHYNISSAIVLVLRVISRIIGTLEKKRF